MEQFYTAPPQPAPVSVIPDKEERRQIRKKYNLTALVLLINILIFNGVAIAVSIALKDSGVFENELFSTAFSFCVPMISEIVSIIVGIKLLRIDFKPLATLDGFNGGTMVKLVILAIGLQTAASMLSAVITAILEQFGLKSPAVDLSATTSLSANLLMYVYACLIGPVLEELLYRGVLLQSMRKYNERFAIFLSAAIFGLMHQNYQQFLLGFLIGIPLAVVTIKSGSIIPAIFTHIIVNTSGMFFNCWIQYSDPEFFNAALNGATDSTAAGFSAAVICTVIFRFAIMFAALIVGILVLVKGGNMSRPTPAGKARTMPIFVTCVLWWIVFIIYALINFVIPFVSQ